MDKVHEECIEVKVMPCPTKLVDPLKKKFEKITGQKYTQEEDNFLSKFVKI